jgi:uncharacterized membrane protein
MTVNLMDALLTIGISAAPLFELRGGIPLALARGFSPAEAFALAVAGNLAVVPLLLWGFQWAERVLMPCPVLGRLLSWLSARSRHKGQWVERWGVMGLVLLVAIPLPGTGAWTGAIASRVLGIPAKKAFWWIALGVIIAGIVVVLAGVGLIRLFDLREVA